MVPTPELEAGWCTSIICGVKDETEEEKMDRNMSYSRF